VRVEPAVDVITVTHNSALHLPAYIEGLSALDYPPRRLRLIVVDNASNDDTRHCLRRLAPRLPFDCDLIESESNVGFGAACNRAASSGSAPLLLFLNPDTVVGRDMLRRLVERTLAEPRAGLVDAAQEPVDLMKWCDPQSGDTDWCSGGAVLARREAFLEVGGFDPFFFLYCEDVDLSWRMWLGGWRCITERRARVRHDTTDGGAIKPLAMYYSIRNSFAMRLIYDTPRGACRHFVRGLRYLGSPRSEMTTRRAVASGFWLVARGLPHLLARRRAAQSALAATSEREHFVFTEWFYGRFVA
jgi:GT2 family glycosyltransferase